MSRMHPELEIKREYKGNHYIYSHTPCGLNFPDIGCAIKHVRCCPALRSPGAAEIKLPVRPGKGLLSSSVRITDENNALRAEVSGLKCRVAELELELAEKTDKHARGLKDRDRAVAAAEGRANRAEYKCDKLQDRLRHDVVTYTSAMHKLSKINDGLKNENKSLKERIDFLAAALAIGEEKPVDNSSAVAPEERTVPEGQQVE